MVELFPEEEDTEKTERHQSTITSDNNFALYEVSWDVGNKEGGGDKIWRLSI